MSRPSTHLFLESQSQLPGRLDFIRGGFFTYDENTSSYISRQHPQIRVVSHTLADCYAWALSIDGGTQCEKLWTKTSFVSASEGWLATQSGALSVQHWYIGDVNQYGGSYVPMQFVDASIKQVPSPPAKLPNDLIAQLMQNFITLRDDNKKYQESILEAVIQRHETEMRNMFHTNSKSIEESRTMMERHVQEALKNESNHFEERNKMLEKGMHSQLEHFEKVMENDAAYRDTLFTEHVLSTQQQVGEVAAQQQRQNEEAKRFQDDHLAKSTEIDSKITDLAGSEYM